jgi:hypothetical protein
MKVELWGDQLTEGLPENFKEFTRIITSMDFKDTPDYEKLISLMTVLDVSDLNGNKTGTREIKDYELNRIQWNSYITSYYDKTIVGE